MQGKNRIFLYLSVATFAAGLSVVVLAILGGHKTELIVLAALTAGLILVLAWCFNRKISRLTHTEHELELSLADFREHLDLVVRGAHAGIWDWDAKTNVVRHSNMARGILKYPDDDDQGLAGPDLWQDRILSEDLGNYQQAFRKHYAGPENTHHVEYRVRDIEGNIRWISERAASIRDDSGQIVRMAGGVSDITELVQARQELEISEQRLRNLIEGSMEGIIVHRNDKVLFANHTAASMLGYSDEELLNLTSILDIAPPATREKQAKMYERRRRGDHAAKRYTSQARRKNGEVLDIQVLSQVVKWDGENAIQAVLLDITERVRAEAALAESENRFRGLVEGSIEGVIVISEGRIVFANDAMCDMFCYTQQGIMALSSADDLLIDTEKIRVRGIRDARLRGEKVVERYETIGRRGDGSIIHFEVLSNAIIWQNEQCVQATLIDITDRKRAEENMHIAMSKAEAANLAKTEFLANMSHELRTPLNAVIGFAQFIKTEPYGKLGSSRYVEYLTNIQDSGNHLLDIISDILDLARIEAGKLVPEYSDVEMPDIIDTCVRFLEHNVSEKNIKMISTVQENLPVLEADRRMVRQILLNVLSNAVKFTSDNGEISIDVSSINDDILRIVVADNGIGMESSDIPVALEKFGQVESALKLNKGGTGLGLPLVRSMIEMHGGQIEIDSRIGQGTTVMLEFPLNRRDLQKVG